MIFLFTDFGAHGPYLGQVTAAVRLAAPGVDVIDLVNNAPNGNPDAAAYLLAALASVLPADCVVLGVVDPGVGGERDPVVLHADGRWFVGPDNGLFNVVAVHAVRADWNVIDWRPARLSASFHGRDLFAPIAARIAKRDFLWAHHPRAAPNLCECPADRDQIIYFDTFGNAFTGRRYDPSLTGKRLAVSHHVLPEAKTFCAVAHHAAFWYRNSAGLVEIAVNRDSARQALGLELGMPVRFID